MSFTTSREFRAVTLGTLLLASTAGMALSDGIASTDRDLALDVPANISLIQGVNYTAGTRTLENATLEGPSFALTNEGDRIVTYIDTEYESTIGDHRDGARAFIVFEDAETGAPIVLGHATLPQSEISGDVIDNEFPIVFSPEYTVGKPLGFCKSNSEALTDEQRVEAGIIEIGSFTVNGSFEATFLQLPNGNGVAIATDGSSTCYLGEVSYETDTDGPLLLGSLETASLEIPEDQPGLRN